MIPERQFGRPNLFYGAQLATGDPSDHRDRNQAQSITSPKCPIRWPKPASCRQSSARGVCPVCGAPWVRDSGETDQPDASAKGSRFDQGKTGARDGGDRTQAGIGSCPSLPGGRLPAPVPHRAAKLRNSSRIMACAPICPIRAGAGYGARSVQWAREQPCGWSTWGAMGSGSS